MASDNQEEEVSSSLLNGLAFYLLVVESLDNGFREEKNIINRWGFRKQELRFRRGWVYLTPCGS